jgi:hypothetical protein
MVPAEALLVLSFYALKDARTPLLTNIAILAMRIGLIVLRVLIGKSAILAIPYSGERGEQRPGGTAQHYPVHATAGKGANGQRHAAPPTAAGESEETKDPDRVSFS